MLTNENFLNSENRTNDVHIYNNAYIAYNAVKKMDRLFIRIASYSARLYYARHQ